MQRRIVPPSTVVAATRSASDSNFVAAKENSFACSGRGSYDLPCLILILLQQRRMVSPAAVVAATRSASDYNFVAAKENGFACSGCSDKDLSRPLLIFVAA